MMSDPSFAKMMSDSVKTIKRGNQTMSDETVWRSTMPDFNHCSSGGSFENAFRTAPTDAVRLTANEPENEANLFVNEPVDARPLGS
jgi:hypothetical protein